MKKTLHRWLLLMTISLTLAKENVDLPLCPTNLQYFPQELPMHCRMPGNSESRQHPEMPQYQTLPPLPESFYQSPSPDKQAPPIPIPIPPFPGMPMGPMGGPLPGMPGPMPLPVPVVGGPAHKMPVIVMPFYSPDHSFKNPHSPHHDNHYNQDKHKTKKKPSRKKKKSAFDSDTDASDDDTSSGGSTDETSGSSSEHGYWKGRRKARRKMTRRFNKRHRMRKKEKRNMKKDLLTPILQYVTKDGYVIFEKKISKNEAKDWLKPKNEVNEVLEEVKPEEKEIAFLDNAERSPPSKARVKEEIPVKNKENNSMASEEVEETTQSKKVSPRKHRQRKINALVNIPDQDTQ